MNNIYRKNELYIGENEYRKKWVIKRRKKMDTKKNPARQYSV